MEQEYFFIGTALAVGILFGWMLRGSRVTAAKRSAKQLQDSLKALDILHEKVKSEYKDLEAGARAAGERSAMRDAEHIKMVETLSVEKETLLRKSEESDTLLKEGQPMVHSLKLKLIEANNTIARYKAKIGPLI